MKEIGFAFVVVISIILSAAGSAQTLDEDFDNMSEWDCITEPKDGMGGDRHSGKCEVNNGSLVVREESNNPRLVVRNITLPEDSAYIFIDMDSSLQNSYSQAKLRLIVDSSEEYIVGADNDYSSRDRNCSQEGWKNISEYAGQEVKLEFRTIGRHIYKSSETMSEINADEIKVLQEKPSGDKVESCGEGSKGRSRFEPEKERSPYQYQDPSWDRQNDISQGLIEFGQLILRILI